MDKKVQEWLKQADYDMDTAEFMCRGGRHFYAVFMCHIAIEKGLKGLYQQRLQETPPKTHNLIYLLSQTGVKPDEDRGKVITKLNEANIATRYPDDIDALQGNYTAEITMHILAQARDTLEWIRKQF